MYDAAERILRTKVLTSQNKTRTCRSPRSPMSLIGPSMQIGWFKTDFRYRSTACFMYFLQDGCRNERLTKFGPVLVSNAGTTGCMED